VDVLNHGISPNIRMLVKLVTNKVLVSSAVYCNPVVVLFRAVPDLNQLREECDLLQTVEQLDASNPKSCNVEQK